jgi:hypothetical protein
MRRKDEFMRTRDSRSPLAHVWIAALVGSQLLGTHDRAARADAPPGRYVTGSDGATLWVKDNRTGLVWKQAEESGTFGWAAAKTQCASPWRLPTVRELQSLVDETRTAAPAIDVAFFPAASSGNLWSSSPDAMSGGAKAWNVDFGTGADFNAVVGTPGGVRCVR